MPRTLEQWLEHQGRAHPQAIDLGLHRLRAVIERLGWQQPRVPVITVGGTNGKGSVTAYCAAILRAAGYRVGTFSSPHLKDYRERIRVSDRLVSEAELLTAFERIEAACVGPAAPERISLTFFEYNALAAFLTFEAAHLDAWVLEVGMGGRLDAVNVVDPSVAAVVSIGVDHEAFLGHTREAIAREKAGIFRKQRTAVLGSRDLPPVLMDLALAVGAIPKRLGQEFDVARGPTGWRFVGAHWDLPNLPAPALAGDIQYDNAATALAILEDLAQRLPIVPAAVARGLESVELKGRFQVIAPRAGGPTWILDVAHNPDAARVLAHNLRALPAAGRTLMVCGILADKDAPAIAAEVRDCCDDWWLVPIEGERGGTAVGLAQRIAAQLARPPSIARDVASACAAAQRRPAPGTGL